MGMFSLVQSERDKRWCQYYNDYLATIPTHQISVTTVDAANRYADEMMEQEDEQQQANEPNI